MSNSIKRSLFVEMTIISLMHWGVLYTWSNWMTSVRLLRKLSLCYSCSHLKFVVHGVTSSKSSITSLYCGEKTRRIKFSAWNGIVLELRHFPKRFCVFIFMWSSYRQCSWSKIKNLCKSSINVEAIDAFIAHDWN